MFIIALTLACTGRPSTTPEPAADPVVEVPSEVVAEVPSEVVAGVVEATANEEAPAIGAPLADGTACLTASDCISGICEGLGCDDDTPGLCAPTHRACTRDLRPYCGCDGVTFRTSGSCPGKRYASKDACAGDPGLGLPLTPP